MTPFDGPRPGERADPAAAGDRPPPSVPRQAPTPLGRLVATVERLRRAAETGTTRWSCPPA
ncbi:hypothetical protein PL81_11050 [Streptomyces sp. RSD-27]|nr:hypothetical protein PL81_11050 [Streptomyces sp. RSD-27]